jgi:hypothetical protein
MLEGFVHTRPKIGKLKFATGKMIVCLEDGREISVPVRCFPGISKLTTKERNAWMIVNDEAFLFKTPRSTEVYHLEQILGKETHYRYRGV